MTLCLRLNLNIFICQRKKFAVEIYNDHICSDGDDQINITSDIVEDIEKNLAKADATLFDAAQRHVSVYAKLFLLR